MEKLGSHHARVHAYCRGDSGRQVPGQPACVRDEGELGTGVRRRRAVGVVREVGIIEAKELEKCVAEATLTILRTAMSAHSNEVSRTGAR